jgi:thioredoxin 1
VDFFTEACAPCRMLAPVFAEISAERPELKVIKVDAGTNYEVASNFNISSVPTMILFRDGQPIGQLSGARSKKDLLAWIETTR